MDPDWVDDVMGVVYRFRSSPHLPSSTAIHLDQHITWSAMIHDLKTFSSSRIVFVDIPDPDNVLMVLQVLRDFPNEHIAVVLSPRPVSFAIPPYGDEFAPLESEVGLKRMIAPSSQVADREWMTVLDSCSQAWFALDLDQDCCDSAVLEDTRLYMSVSACRFRNFLDAHGVSSSRYELFWDEDGSPSKIAVGMRHAFHVPDYTYDFNDAERSRYQEVLESAANTRIEEDSTTVRSADLRDTIRSICDSYIHRHAKAWSPDQASGVPTNMLRNLHELMVANVASNTTANMIIGGPFTEALVFLQHAPVRSVTAMGGFIHGGSNLFPNQFNFHVDMTSAKLFLDLIVEKSISCTLLPTEAVKGTVFALTQTELDCVVAESPAARKLIGLYHRDSHSTGRPYTLYDWIAAIAFTHSDLLPTRKVSSYLQREPDGTEVIRFREDNAGRICMFWNDAEHMQNMKAELIEIMRNTVIYTNIDV
jgi:inosine-uridine nucleoside N-ribohydrolase